MYCVGLKMVTSTIIIIVNNSLIAYENDTLEGRWEGERVRGSLGGVQYEST